MASKKSELPLRPTLKEIEAHLTSKVYIDENYSLHQASCTAKLSSRFWRLVVNAVVCRWLCGYAPCFELFTRYSNQLIPLDLRNSHAEQQICTHVRYLGHTSGCRNSIINAQELEHQAEPFEVVKKAGQALKFSIFLFLFVPNLSWLHELLHDFSQEKITIDLMGGLFTFRGHQISPAFHKDVWKAEILKLLLKAIDKFLITKLIVKCGKLIGFPSFFSQDLAKVAIKL